MWGNEEGTDEERGFDSRALTICIPESLKASIPMLNRWFNSSTSTDHMREWVEKYMELKTCPTCLGTRLKRDSVWFRVDNQNISQLSDIDLDKLFVWFERRREAFIKKTKPHC